MPSTIRDVMTPDPITLHHSMPIHDAARTMRQFGIGDVLVQHADGSIGIVTDRDLAVRALAEGADPHVAAVGDYSSDALVVVDADDPIDAAVRIMREQGVRRIPVMDDGRLAGIISVGDLAAQRDPGSVSAELELAHRNT